jgi:hypothetical protein
MKEVADAIGRVLGCLFVTCLIAVPLGIWKLVDIILWIIE